MKKKSVWGSPPSYGGPGDNKRAICRLSKMCFGLSAMTSANRSTVARRLESIGTSLRIKISIAGHKAFIFANVIDIYEDLTSLRSALCDADNAGEVEHYLNSLEANVKVLGTFLEHEIDESPMEANMNRFVRKFVSKKSAVETIERATESSLADAERKLHRLQLSETRTERERSRKEQKIANLKGFIKVRQSAADTLDSIVDRLNELEDTARLSPGLARRLNRLIHLKLLADFYDKPLRSQKEREALYMHLYYLAQNQINGEIETNKLNGLLNQTILGESTEPGIEGQTEPMFDEQSGKEPTQRQSQNKSQRQKNLNIGGIQ